GRVLGHAMVSSDARAAQISRDWSREFGTRRLYEITGHTAHPMFTLFKLLWLREHQPDVWHAAWKFLCFEDLLAYRLGLEPALGFPLAGRTMLFDVRRHCWSADILTAAGLASSKLAQAVPSGTILGKLSPARTRQLRLAEGAVVVAGGHDQPCGALGAGVVEEGSAMYASGTVECVCAAFRKPIFRQDLQDANLCTYDYTLEGMYTTVAFSLTGGNLLKWFRDEWSSQEQIQAAGSGEDVYELILRQLPDRPTDLLVLPYFTPSGTPYFDTQTRGAILGLRLASTRGQVLRALLEGVALEMRLNLDLLDRAGRGVQRLLAIGGGARNRNLLQLKADVLNRPITTIDVTEAGCLGVAMLALAAVEKTTPATLAKEWVRPTAVITPNPIYADIYDASFERYQRLYPVVKQFFQESPA
ncbi:MAG: FGGY-family carbohydrate kinase, partial [Phycisphaerae bacterium]